MSMPITIRTAEPEDISFIMSVEEQSFAPDIRESEQVFMDRMTFFNDGFLIFSENGTDAGYLTCELWKEVPSNPEAFALGHDIKKALCPDGRVLYISSFAILPQFRGKGLAEESFRQALEFFSGQGVAPSDGCRKASLSGRKKELTGIETFILMVNETWKAAHHIYSKAGFRELFRLPGTFRNEDGSVTDGIIMTMQAQSFPAQRCPDLKCGLREEDPV